MWHIHAYIGGFSLQETNEKSKAQSTLNLNRWLKKIRTLCLVLFVMALTVGGLQGDELMEPPKSVRIGLVTYFEHVEYIHFYNNTVVPGFYENDAFVGEAVITTSGKDFWFSAATKLYLESEQTYSTYEEALVKVAPLREAGYKAYATLIARGTWKVFAGHKATQAELDQVKAAINGLNDVTYIQAPASYERVIMESGSNYPMMFENRYGRTVFSTNDLRGTVPVIDLGKRSYRGYIEPGRYGHNDMTAVNVVDLDDYLYSVVKSEIYADWPVESIKAQSVAARTFAVYYKEIARKFPNDPFDLDDTINSQVYKGFSVEDERVNVAVDATSGEMIYYNGKVIPAYFFASSGGRTENSEDVWSGTVPYLKSVPDIYENEPEKHPWLKVITPSEIKSALAKRDINIGDITDVQVDAYTDAGRAMNLIVYGTGGSYTLKKETMRYWLGLNSRKFILLKSDYKPDYTRSVMNGDGVVSEVNYTAASAINGNGDVTPLLNGLEQVIVMGTENIINQPMVNGQSGAFIFAGEGWGHGAGMSQSGARGMANVGYGYKEILEYYYTGVKVQ